MTTRTPGRGAKGDEASPMMTRRRRALETASNQGAVTRSYPLQPGEDHNAENEQHDEAAGGGETSADHLLTFEDYQGAFHSPIDDPPMNSLRDTGINHGPPSHHSTGTVAETLTRLQVDMVRRNCEEMNKLKQMMREEMQLVMRDMQHQMRELTLSQQTGPRPEYQPYVRLPSSQPMSRNRNGESGRSDQYPRSESVRHREGTLKIDKWGIKFDGDSSKMSVDDFIFRVEHLKAYHQVSWAEVIGDFHKLLGQKASEWYWIQVRMTGVPDWQTLRAALLRTYSSRLTNFELERELMERVQKPGESIDDYIHEMCRLRAQLRTPIEVAEMVRVLKRNVREAVGKILFPMNIDSVEKLRAEYHAIEKAFMRGQQSRTYPAAPTQRPYNRLQVNEVSQAEHRDDWYDRDEILVEEVHGERLTCWNCRETGHNYVACTRARTIFCYKCGKANVITPKCPNCRAGNLRRGPTTASVSSSTQTEQ